MGSDAIKTVIKVLALTFIIPVVICLLIEMFNSALTPIFMRGIINKSVEQACRYFTQETYKRDDGTFAAYKDAHDLYFSNGDLAVSGTFYANGNSQAAIFNSIYKSSAFKNWLTSKITYEGSGTSSKQVYSLWTNLNRFYLALYSKEKSSEAYKIGKTYLDNYTTALNLGVTYLDEDIIEKICKWNMVANLYRGDPNMLHQHSSKLTGSNASKMDYVLYDGFKLYFNTFQIDSIEYTAYDVTTTNGRTKFASVVHLGDDVTGSSYWKNAGVTSGDERGIICVAKVDYSMKVGYDGITPIRNIIQFYRNRTGTVTGAGNDGGDQVLGWSDGIGMGNDGSSSSGTSNFASNHSGLDYSTIDQSSYGLEDYSGKDLQSFSSAGNTYLEAEDVTGSTKRYTYDLDGYNNTVYYYIVR